MRVHNIKLPPRGKSRSLSWGVKTGESKKKAGGERAFSGLERGRKVERMTRCHVFVCSGPATHLA
jgi:hypothetical protein